MRTTNRDTPHSERVKRSVARRHHATPAHSHARHNVVILPSGQLDLVIIRPRQADNRVSLTVLIHLQAVSRQFSARTVKLGLTISALTYPAEHHLARADNVNPRIKSRRFQLRELQFQELSDLRCQTLACHNVACFHTVSRELASRDRAVLDQNSARVPGLSDQYFTRSQFARERLIRHETFHERRVETARSRAQLVSRERRYRLTAHRAFHPPRAVPTPLPDNHPATGNLPPHVPNSRTVTIRSLVRTRNSVLTVRHFPRRLSRLTRTLRSTFCRVDILLGLIESFLRSRPLHRDRDGRRPC